MNGEDLQSLGKNLSVRFQHQNSKLAYPQPTLLNFHRADPLQKICEHPISTMLLMFQVWSRFICSVLQELRGMSTPAEVGKTLVLLTGARWHVHYDGK